MTADTDLLRLEQFNRELDRLMRGHRAPMPSEIHLATQLALQNVLELHTTRLTVRQLEHRAFCA